MCQASSTEFDQRVDRFDTMWHSGRVPNIDDYLRPQGSAEVDRQAWRTLLAELVMIDLEFRWRGSAAESAGLGQGPSDADGSSRDTLPKRPRLEDYLRRYPQIGPWDELPMELIGEEYRARHRWGDRPTHEEYRKRFGPHGNELQDALQQIDAELAPSRRGVGLHVRCPHCNSTVDWVSDATVTDACCPSCGGSFSLLSGEPEGGDGSRPLKIGRFDLLHKLGSGTFGTVWKARDRELDRSVAVKIPRRTQPDDTQAEQFLREARVVAQLNHPNIVGVHEVGRDGETIFIVTDMVVGDSLSEWQNARRVSFSETAKICAKIADALHHAHQAGVVHRDLKPQNVIVDRHGEPKLTDFGLARRQTGEVTMTVDGQVLGTPAYMSPEQAQGRSHQADSRSDIYSLGVILFQMLTGEMPFRGSVHMLMHQIIHDEAPQPRRLNGHVPRDLETICLKCLEKSARNRYLSSQELADELRRFLRGEPIRARAITRFGRTWRWCQRYPMAAVVVAMALSLAIVGPLVAWNQTRLATREVAAREESRRRLYVADMVVAQQAWEAANVGRVRDLIARHVPGPGQTDLRGFQWYYLWRLCEEIDQVPTLEGHQASIWALAFAPDSKTLASGALGGTVMLWDVPAQKPLGKLSTGSQMASYSLTFTPDGAALVSVGVTADGGLVRIWDVERRKVQREHFVKTLVTSVAVTRDTRDRTMLAWGTYDGTAYLCRLEALDQAEKLEGQHARWVTSLAFSPDGRTLVSGSSDNTVKLWDVPTRKVRQTLTGHKSWVRSVAVSSSGTTIASAGQDNIAILWDLQSGRQKGTPLVHKGRLWSVAFSPDGNSLATAGSDGRVKLWDVARGKVKSSLTGHDNPSVLAVAWSPDGKTVVSAGADATIKLWDVTTRRAQDTLVGHRQAVISVAISPDGNSLASGAMDGTVNLWDLRTGAMLYSLTEHKSWVTSVAFSHDGALLASAGEDFLLKLWDAHTGAELKPSLVGHGPTAIMSVAFSPDRKTLASAAWDGTVILWDIPSGQLRKTLLGHRDIVWDVAFSPDGRRLASAGWADTTVRLWNVDAETEEAKTLSEHTRPVYSVAFSPDGTTLASGSEDTTVKLWDLTTYRVRHTLKGHAGEVRSVVFSPDGKTLASGSNDTTIKLWYLGTDREPETLTGHESAVSAVVFSRDGLVLASASEDKTIKIWRRARESDVTLTDWQP